MNETTVNQLNTNDELQNNPANVTVSVKCAEMSDIYKAKKKTSPSETSRKSSLRYTRTSNSLRNKKEDI